jgi:hypothetical protein
MRVQLDTNTGITTIDVRAGDPIEAWKNRKD